MDAPELAALVILEHAIEVAWLAMLAQHVELLDPDAPRPHEPGRGSSLATRFFARAHALSDVIHRYRAVVAEASRGFDGARDDRGCSDDDF